MLGYQTRFGKKQLTMRVIWLIGHCFCWNLLALEETVTRDSIFRNPLSFVPKFLLRPSLSARKENDRDTPVFLSPMIKLIRVVEYLMLRPISSYLSGWSWLHLYPCVDSHFASSSMWDKC